MFRVVMRLPVSFDVMCDSNSPTITSGSVVWCTTASAISMVIGNFFRFSIRSLSSSLPFVVVGSGTMNGVLDNDIFRVAFVDNLRLPPIRDRVYEPVKYLSWAGCLRHSLSPFVG